VEKMLFLLQSFVELEERSCSLGFVSSQCHVAVLHNTRTGVYGENYMLCHPLLEWEMPVVWNALQHQVPASLWTCLDSFCSLQPTQMKMQFFILAHTAPIPQECQKLMCSNWNEVNMVYHAWLFPITSFTPEVTEVEQVDMGIFGAFGVRPVHQDLKDAGISFDSLSLRTVALHNRCFSPENAQFQLVEDPENEIASFWAFAYHEKTHRAVLSFHILPRHYDAEVKLRKVVASADSVRNFLSALHSIDTHSAVTLLQILPAIEESSSIANTKS
jgi:hypothetical protein